MFKHGITYTRKQHTGMQFGTQRTAGGGSSACIHDSSPKLAQMWNGNTHTHARGHLVSLWVKSRYSKKLQGLSRLQGGNSPF